MMEYARGLLVMEKVMKLKMWNYFSANSTQNYIKVLDDMVHNSNNKVNSSIKLTRTEASVKNRYPMGTCVCCSGMESAVGAYFFEYC